MSKSSTICQRLYIWRSVVVSTAIFALLTGCGENVTTAGVGTGGTGSVSITGKVADGYLVNASVFLDKNGNYQLDTGEPFTTTDANGAYKLNIDPADVGKFPIVALVIKGVAIDKDTNQAVANSYVLSMPKDSVSDTTGNNFISPVTSQLRELMETGSFTTMQQAADALQPLGPAGERLRSQPVPLSREPSTERHRCRNEAPPERCPSVLLRSIDDGSAENRARLNLRSRDDDRAPLDRRDRGWGLAMARGRLPRPLGAHGCRARGRAAPEAW
jgi:hypothetical protein